MKKEVHHAYQVELAEYSGTVGAVHRRRIITCSLRDGAECLVFSCSPSLAAELKPLWGCSARLLIETITTGGIPRHRLLGIEAVYGR